MRFAVIGGDMRQLRLAELLAADGHDVKCFAMEREEPAGVKPCSTAAEAAGGAECVVLPLPVCGRDGCLNAPLSDSRHFIESVFAALLPGQLICAGRVTRAEADTAERLGLEITDYYAREELAVMNAAATAEGAIQIAMEETPAMLCGSECLVIGYGRIGKMLSHRLRMLGAEVTVSARRQADKAWIRGFGLKAADTGRLEDALGGADIVFNTVPACVLPRERLALLKPGCICIDLASKPGGMDFSAASALGIKAVWALSLPGRAAPLSAGAAIRDTLYNILEEREKENE
ncbi:MAG: dipicolinate synthase subunit DpsA [Oscillospiraceae bacterium]|nr:dipicolinate synthase subunit DpsA [Oscillospiraceae bacterium]